MTSQPATVTGPSWQARQEELSQYQSWRMASDRRAAAVAGLLAGFAPHVSVHGPDVTAVAFGSRPRRWHLDEACPRADSGAGHRFEMTSFAHDLTEFAHSCRKLSPCSVCALPAMLALDAAVGASVRDGHLPDGAPFPAQARFVWEAEQVVLTCSDAGRDDHRRCRRCQLLIDAAELVGAPWHRDTSGFAVAALDLVPEACSSARSLFVVHYPPSGFTGRLGRDGLAAAWALRSCAPSRGVRRSRFPGRVSWCSDGDLAWLPADALVPSGT